jgi:calcineurin-like phosphoesterase family protein
MSNIFFSSDHHFFHSNIIKYSSRPFSSVEEMNEKLIQNHNSIVKPNDQVWLLGDFAFAKQNEIINTLKRLNGNKHLVLGNHDSNIENNPRPYIGNGFSTIQRYKELKIDNKLIVLNHFSLRTWLKNYNGSWHLFGHSHGKLDPLGLSVDVGVDSPFITGKAEYRPFSIDEIKLFMDSQSQIAMDYKNEM